MGWAIALSPEPFTRTRWSLAALYAGVLAAVLGGAGLVTHLMVERALLDQVDEVNRQAALTMSQALQWQGGRLVAGGEFQDEAREARETRGVAWVQVLDVRGGQVSAAGTRHIGNGSNGLPEGATTLAADGSEVRLLVQPVVMNGHRRGTLVVGHTLRETRAIMHRFRRGMAIAIPLSLAVTCLAGYALAGFAMRPIRAAFEQQRRFLADASHELRTPLAILQTQAGVALEARHPEPLDLLDAMKVIERNAARMGRLVDDLLFLSRADARGVPLVCRPLDLEDLMEDLLDELAPLAHASGGQLALVADGGDLTALADPRQVDRLARNLLENAIKFSGAGGKVTVRLDGSDRQVLVLRVSDSGPGIRAEDLPHIFERFYRADASRSADVPGTGLGLAIARAIAEAHGGTLTAVSPAGGGACFELRLPRRPSRGAESGGREG